MIRRKNASDRRSAAHREIHGIIGEGDRLSGEFRFEGGYRVDGRLEGKLTSNSTVIVGPPGEVEVEEMHVSNLLVNGVVRGTLHIEKRLEIYPGGKVLGTVTMNEPNLVVSPGGSFEGKVIMEEPAPEQAKAPDS